MRAVIQRVTKAAVTIVRQPTSQDSSVNPEQIYAQIGPGLLVLLGVAETDTEDDVTYLANKIANLRLFGNQGGFEKSVSELQNELLVVSQFTLLADCRKGRRPSFTAAAKPEKAKKLYDLFIFKLKLLGLKVKSGLFQAHMHVSLVNDGPVTVILDSKR